MTVEDVYSATGILPDTINRYVKCNILPARKTEQNELEIRPIDCVHFHEFIYELYKGGDYIEPDDCDLFPPNWSAEWIAYNCEGLTLPQRTRFYRLAQGLKRKGGF